MKKLLPSISMLCLVCLLFCTQSIAQDSNTPLTRDEINAKVDRHFATNGYEPFNWNTTDAHTRWSASLLANNLIAIGYYPAGMNRFDFKKGIGDFDFNSPEWENVRLDIINTTLADIIARNPDMEIDRNAIFRYGEKQPLPYVIMQVFDMETIQALMDREDTRFVEPLGYSYVAPENKSGVGCGSYADPSINAADLVSISDNGFNSVRSWHHDFHNVPCAWSNGWTGAGIDVAVLDSGVSDVQSQLNAGFTTGNSSVRSYNKTGFYQGSTNWVDDCGHGTSMSGLLSGPWNNTATPVGIAYQANFNSYRVAPNVLLETSDEQVAVANAYNAAAGNTVRITSMSLGYIFSVGIIETAVQNAYANGVMMFCAAGTSTSFTGWYPVIFPAWMPETVAITGVNDAGIGSRDRCETCHDGPEVDFVTVMERASDDSRKAVSLGMPDLSMGYVGGSSAGTASMAGMAAVIWSANPGETREQIYNRMAQSADYYPGRDDDFGWGVVDVCKAADPNFAAPCDPTLANSAVTIEITNIVFPADDDFWGSDNEWVIELNGQKYYFDVPENGASGAPSVYHNNGNCGSMPMILNLGATTCGQNSITINSDIHEDNDSFGNCNYDPSFFGDDDDDQHAQNINIDFTTNTFIHNHPSGNFVFTFNATCSPASTPAVSVGGLARVCQGDTPPDVTFNFAGGTPPYTATYNINGGSTQTITTTGTNTSATVPASTATAGVYTYNVTQVSDALGCSTQTGTYTLEVLSTCVLEVVPRIFLQGPYNTGTGLMNNDLTSMMPTTDPYGLGTSLGAGAMSGTGNDAIVDWVMVELRDGTTNTAILATVAALVQADGDVVSATDGVSPVQIPYSGSGNFHIAVHHRNHLAIMTDTPVYLLPSQL